MSRSYRKHPFVTDSGRCRKWAKRQAASRIRNIPVESEESEVLVQSPSAFRKINHDSWDICDYRYIWTKNDVIKLANEYQGSENLRDLYRRIYGTVEDAIEFWKKCVVRK